jgi:molybdopterin converting factor subunit 1
MSDPKHATVRVLYFAGARDVVGVREEPLEIDANGCTVAELSSAIYAKYPALAPHARSLRIAVNGEYAKDTDRVAPGDEVAMIPPVAGG